MCSAPTSKEGKMRTSASLVGAGEVLELQPRPRTEQHVCPRSCDESRATLVRCKLFSGEGLDQMLLLKLCLVPVNSFHF